jgi:hypothetical protein
VCDAEVDLATGEMLPAPAVELAVLEASDDAVVGDEPRTDWRIPVRLTSADAR